MLAGFLGQQLGWYAPGEGAGFLAAIVGAVLILLVYRLIARASGSETGGLPVQQRCSAACVRTQAGRASRPEWTRSMR